MVLTQDSSAGVSKRALIERDACGRRLKRMGFSGDTTGRGDRLVLESSEILLLKSSSAYAGKLMNLINSLTSHRATGPGAPSFPFERQNH